MQTKKWWQSKTIWLNVLTALIGILAVVDAQILEALGVENTTRFLTILGLIATIGNIVLRLGGTPNDVISTKPTGTPVEPKP